METETVWEGRYFVYGFWAREGRSPAVRETAEGLGIEVEEARALYAELNGRHALMLMPGTDVIRMANPFSGVETSFKVYANNKTYFANCAWDSLGIPAALHVDAKIDTACAQSGEPIRLRVTDQQVQDSDALVHFLIPFQNWYDDLAFT